MDDSGISVKSTFVAWHIVHTMYNSENAVGAAHRVLSAYDAGVAPACRDIWTMQLSIRSRDAADLLLGYEDLARKIIRECGIVSAA
jgi:hypothetical protein